MTFLGFQWHNSLLANANFLSRFPWLVGILAANQSEAMLETGNRLIDTENLVSKADFVIRDECAEYLNSDVKTPTTQPFVQ